MDLCEYDLNLETLRKNKTLRVYVCVQKRKSVPLPAPRLVSTVLLTACQSHDEIVEKEREKEERPGSSLSLSLSLSLPSLCLFSACLSLSLPTPPPYAYFYNNKL